jgi:hypothetical protein
MKPRQTELNRFQMWIRTRHHHVQYPAPAYYASACCGMQLIRASAAGPASAKLLQPHLHWHAGCLSRMPSIDNASAAAAPISACIAST